MRLSVLQFDSDKAKSAFSLSPGGRMNQLTWSKCSGGSEHLISLNAANKI